MSVLIRGMNMPGCCAMCPMCHRNFDGNETRLACYALSAWCMEDEDRLENCPLVELPEKHGRLIDENDVIDAIHDRLHELQTHKEFAKKHGDIDLLGVLPYIAKIQSVIEAEGEG